MLDYCEVSYHSYIRSHCQCQWVIGQRFLAYGPAYKLITFVSSCCQCSSCTFCICASTLYTTHRRIVHGGGYGMLDYCEVSYHSYIRSHCQCQWILSQNVLTYGPVNKLMTRCCCRSQSSGCTFCICACTLYTTHRRIVSSNGNGVIWFWQGEGVLVSCRSRNHSISSMRHSIDSYAVSCIAARSIGSYVEVAGVVPCEIHE